MQNIFLLIRQKCSKINGAHLRPGALSYYSLCHNSNIFRAWSSLFHKHTPSKILMNKYNVSIFWAWTSFFHKHAQENRAKEQVILHADKLPLYFLCSFCWYFHKIVWWFYFNEISNCCVFASLPVYSTLPFYLKLESTIIQGNYYFKNNDL